MKWHDAKKEMPPRDVLVILAWRDAYDEYNKEDVAIVKSNVDRTRWIEFTTHGGGYSFDVANGDKWAYIELPERGV